jgi:hypothetical protein
LNSTGLESETSLWETVGMKKPHLVILSDAGDPVLKARCSSCESVTFALTSNTESSLSLIHEMFSKHFRKVHMREDAKAYVPKPGDPVLVEGVQSRLVVVAIDAINKTATVSTPTTPGGVYKVPWSKLSPLDESQNALRVVREATESGE